MVIERKSLCRIWQRLLTIVTRYNSIWRNRLMRKIEKYNQSGELLLWQSKAGGRHQTRCRRILYRTVRKAWLWFPQTNWKVRPQSIQLNYSSGSEYCQAWTHHRRRCNAHGVTPQAKALSIGWDVAAASSYHVAFFPHAIALAFVRTPRSLRLETNSTCSMWLFEAVHHTI